MAAIIAALRSRPGTLRGVAVESTYNWYWLVDGLQDAGFSLHLVNTAAVKQYDGLKYSGDFSDARHLAHLLRLGILPTGYIYPRDDAMALLDEQKLAIKAIKANLVVMRCMDVQVKALERSILAKAKPRQDFQALKTVSGIGDVLQALQATPHFEGLQWIEGAGHWVHFESPAAFDAVLLGMLDRSES